MSYNLFFALMAILLSQLFSQASIPYKRAGIKHISNSLNFVLTSSYPTCVFAPISHISLLIMSHHLVFSSVMCSDNCPFVDIVIPRYLNLPVLYVFQLLLFHLFLILILPVLTVIYCVFFRLKPFSFSILAQLNIYILMCSALPVVAMSFINTGNPIFILPYLYFT